ncbi:Mut7-C RNAse domain-containing protein [Chloroflexota bacterium]
MAPKFIVDLNVGRLAKWLRVTGFDTLFLKGIDDNRLIRVALEEGRIVLTRDRQIAERRLVTIGRLKVILIEDDDVREQLRQVVATLNLSSSLKPFTLCLNCNQLLVPKSREEVRDKVPPYVFQTQTRFVQCPSCERIYWRGTHWQRMTAELEKLVV